MNALLAASPSIDGFHSLEVRWIIPGQLDAAMTAWFSRFPAEIAAREDTYLMAPHLPGLSVKIRAGKALEVKAYYGSPGILDARHRARGRMQSYQKWSFPVSPPGPGAVTAAAWAAVHKSRRISRFRQASGQIIPGSTDPAYEPGCAVELTKIRTSGQAWWSLGLEATGPATLLPGVLEETATHVFASALPEGVDLGPNLCRTYAEWLGGGMAGEAGQHVFIDERA